MTGAGGKRLATGTTRRLLRMGLLANIVGALLVFFLVGTLGLLFFEPDEVNRLGLINGIVSAIYLAVTFPITFRVSLRYGHRLEEWVAAERPPADEERRFALGQPLRLTTVGAVSWTVGAVMTLILNLIVSTVGFAITAAMTVVLGGLTTCALFYLLAERILRPITALALAPGPMVHRFALGVRARLVMAWTLATGVPLLGVVVVAAVGMTVGRVEAEDVSGAVLFLSLLALGVGLLAMLYAARSISDPVGSVRAALQRVEKGDFGAQVPVDDASEIGLLEAGFNRMTAGLAERERLRDLFGRHVGEEVARSALEGAVTLGGEEREVAALFIDIVGSTSLAADRSPTEVVEILNAFFAVVVEVVEEHGGMVNKFEGDAALCVFGAPVAREGFVTEALAAARKLCDRLGEEVPDVDFGVGVSAGQAVAGNVGAEERFEYTVIGDAVNEAARLCELAKQREGRLLASEAALEQAGPEEREHWSLGEAVTLRGRPEPTRLASVG